MKFFHGSRLDYYKSISRDVNKAEWLDKNGFELLELEEKDVKNLSIDYLKEEFGIYIA